MRTRAVRITDNLWAQLDVIGQLNDRSVTEEIRLWLEDWIGRTNTCPVPPCSASLMALILRYRIATRKLPLPQAGPRKRESIPLKTSGMRFSYSEVRRTRVMAVSRVSVAGLSWRG